VRGLFSGNPDLSPEHGESFFDQPVLEPVSLLPGIAVIFDNQTDVFFHDGDRDPAQIPGFD
jgi:hypothetical protein